MSKIKTKKFHTNFEQNYCVTLIHGEVLKQQNIFQDIYVQVTFQISITLKIINKKKS